MKTYRNKVAIYLRRNSPLIQDSGDKRERGLPKSAAVSLKNVNNRQETLACLHQVEAWKRLLLISYWNKNVILCNKFLEYILL